MLWNDEEGAEPKKRKGKQKIGEDGDDEEVVDSEVDGKAKAGGRKKANKAVNISLRGSASKIKKLFDDVMTMKSRRMFSKCCFGHLMDIPPCTVNRTLMCAVLRRYAKWDLFDFDGYDVRCSLKDIALITGLSVTPLVNPIRFDRGDPTSRLRDKYLGTGNVQEYVLLQKIKDLEMNQEKQKEEEEDLLKMHMLYFITVFLLPNSAKNLDPKWIQLAGDYSRFNEHPWGFEVHRLLVESFRHMFPKLSTPHFNAYGCLHVFTVWCYMHLPSLAPPCADRVYPRLLAYELKSRLQDKGGVGNTTLKTYEKKVDRCLKKMDFVVEVEVPIEEQRAYNHRLPTLEEDPVRGSDAQRPPKHSAAIGSSRSQDNELVNRLTKETLQAMFHDIIEERVGGSICQLTRNLEGGSKHGPCVSSDLSLASKKRKSVAATEQRPTDVGGKPGATKKRMKGGKPKAMNKRKTTATNGRSSRKQLKQAEEDDRADLGSSKEAGEGTVYVDLVEHRVGGSIRQLTRNNGEPGSYSFENGHGNLATDSSKDDSASVSHPILRSQEDMQILLTENVKQLQKIIRNCPSCWNQYVQSREAGISVNNVVEPPISGTPVPLPMCPSGFQKQQINIFEKNNLIEVAFNEITRIASEENTWLDVTPTAGLFGGFPQTPQPGMTVETSSFSAIVPLAPADLVQLMMNVDKWTSALSPIVYRGSLGALTAEMESLTHTCTQIQDLQMIGAEFQLPTPLVEARKFSFLRYKRKLANGWAIVDISEDCVHLGPTASSSLQLKCLRRPSGLIIKPFNKDHSQVVWIENVEVFESKSESIYSPLIMSHLPFGAKRWISTLLYKLKRNKSEFALGSHFCREAREDLLNLAETMVMDCLSSANGNPDSRKWQTVSHQVVRLMEKRTVSDVSDNVISASMSFHLPVKPRMVFDHLANRNSKSQWRSQLRWIVSEELIKLVTNDSTNNISLYAKVDGSYLFQEALCDDIFSFVISAPMTVEQKCAACSGKWTEIPLHPSGFLIMPDGSDESSGSLVTISIQINADPSFSIVNLIMTTKNHLVKEITELQITEMLSK